ncbi:hemerythrin domain-containing protein [Colwellia psychrerythraea]|uniref:Hemerythrin HHE cation binding domain protein n=1 Tax=Colwellia psychrerythraea TaxID=28229 RepID=A0A099KCW5_COLPS|nr:hemerythrin domain-containing protein [Colwellia psychrerythraea]KGJ88191.1 Hemerythrin HHE cation binding domain protein [Colwellia psychrerythraea]
MSITTTIDQLKKVEQQRQADQTWQVEQRKGLPAAIKYQLLPLEREQWSKHSRYAGKASFFIQYHGDLLATAAYLKHSLHTLLDSSQTVLNWQQLKGPLSAAQNLVAKAHNHHRIEDHVYFPQFRQIMPQLSKGIDLLDKDHKSLDLALDALSTMVMNMVMTLNQGNVINKQQVNMLQDHALHLQRILQRHLHDEEEVIIPIFLLSA